MALFHSQTRRHVINKGISATKCFVYVLNSLEYMRNLADTVRDTFFNNFDGVRTAFCAHVGTVHEYSFLNSFVVDCIEINASHFTSCVYLFDSNQIVYCDTLGWNIPETFNILIMSSYH